MTMIRVGGRAAIPLRLKAKKAARRVRERVKIDHNEVLYLQLAQTGNAIGWVREHRFHETRRWRFDLAHPGRMIAVEVEGLGHFGTMSHHQRHDGMADDCVKYAEAAIAGWRLIRCTTRQVQQGIALGWIERIMKAP
jgi:very-short-patch-repair endonuclease